MSPYQQDVIDTTLSQYDIQAQKGMQPLAANQVNAGAFGQGRGQVQQAEYQSQSDMNRALLQAQLQQQGYATSGSCFSTTFFSTIRNSTIRCSGNF
jgi:hypothetical protein